MIAGAGALYELLLERDLDAVPAAVAAFRREHSSDELYRAIAEFAVLAYAPSQHAKHAMLATVAAAELRDDLGERWDALLTECAIYAAASRLPWSEPPLPDPPADDGAVAHDLRSAVAAGDRRAGEQWLARRLRDADLLEELFGVASDSFDDLGHGLIVAVGASKLAQRFGERANYVCLRTAIWELTSHARRRESSESTATGGVVGSKELLETLADRMAAERGEITVAHEVFLFDAALEAGGEAIAKASACLEGRRVGRRRAIDSSELPPPVYHLARDCGAYLKSWAIAKRRPEIDRVRAAAYENLQDGPNLEEWSFA